MQLIKLSECGFDYEIISQDYTTLDRITKVKELLGIGITEDLLIEISNTRIRTFEDGEIYSWCDELFTEMKAMNN